jgi:hypothetical protein
MTTRLLFVAWVLCICVFSTVAAAQKKPQKLPRVCGNPDEACKGRANFQPYELPVEWPQTAVIAESEPFYAIILKSAKFDYSSGADCEKVYSENEIQSIQYQFPTNKVFALKCVEAGYNYYTGVGNDFVFIAVYAGKTLAEANKFLKKVQAAEQFPGVKVRKMRVGVNGT